MALVCSCSLWGDHSPCFWQDERVQPLLLHAPESFCFYYPWVVRVHVWEHLGLGEGVCEVFRLCYAAWSRDLEELLLVKNGICILFIEQDFPTYAHRIYLRAFRAAI